MHLPQEVQVNTGCTPRTRLAKVGGRILVATTDTSYFNRPSPDQYRSSDRTDLVPLIQAQEIIKQAGDKIDSNGRLRTEVGEVGVSETSTRPDLFEDTQRTCKPAYRSILR